MKRIASPTGSVLIVNRSGESREVLRTALRLRGVATLEAGAAEQGLALARSHRPEVIILDEEDGDRAGRETRAAYADEAARQKASLVVLGTVRRGESMPEGELVSKPYHYGPLVQRIEELLQSRFASRHAA